MSRSEKENTAIVSAAASAVLAGGKFAAGLATGSLGILSEAIHSLIDFGATLITWFAVRWSDKPPDEEHHYGHAKAESVAALVATGLLFLTTVWIVYEAVHRLATGETHVVLAWWAFAIVVASIVIDFNRARALERTAEKTSSEALAADALHFSSDMWSSLAVLAGLGAVYFGFPMGDAIAALVVSAFVALAGWRLGRRTLDTLLDAAPEGATERIRELVAAQDGVLAVRRLRLRPAGATLFAGVVVDVRRTMPVDDIILLKDRIERLVAEAFPHADVTVTANPVALDDETVFERVILIAQRQGCAIHHLTVQNLDGRMAVSFDLEVDGELPLGAAHGIATKLESGIRAELGADVEVESHIEPLPDRQLEGTEAGETVRARVEKALRSLAASTAKLADLHNVRVRETEGGLFVHYHCRFDPGEAVERVHAAIDRIDHALRQAIPEVHRVIAHAEPQDKAPSGARAMGLL
jgi:cation diffusion facilitator family transporter